MRDSYKRETGKVAFKRIDQDSILKKIYFSEDYCVSYPGHFDARGADTNTSMGLGLTVSANKINASGTLSDNRWV